MTTENNSSQNRQEWLAVDGWPLLVIGYSWWDSNNKQPTTNN